MLLLGYSPRLELLTLPYGLSNSLLLDVLCGKDIWCHKLPLGPTLG